MNSPLQNLAYALEMTCDPEATEISKEVDTMAVMVLNILTHLESYITFQGCLIFSWLMNSGKKGSVQQ